MCGLNACQCTSAATDLTLQPLDELRLLGVGLRRSIRRGGGRVVPHAILVSATDGGSGSAPAGVIDAGGVAGGYVLGAVTPLELESSHPRVLDISLAEIKSVDGSTRGGRTGRGHVVQVLADHVGAEGLPDLTCGFGS